MFFDTKRRQVLIAVCLGLFVVQVDTLALNLALPQIGRALRLGITSLQWITDLYNLTYASLLLTGGLLGDRLGRKGVFATGIALFVAGSAACAFAESLPLLLTGRLVQGIGAALEVPGTVAIIRDMYTDPAQRARAMGVWASVAGFAVAFGPTAGGWLVAHAGWQSIFLLNLPVGSIALIVTLARLKGRQRPASRRIDLPGQALALLFLGALTYFIIEGARLRFRGAWPLLALAGVSLALFLAREAASREPMVPLALFRAPAFSGAVVAAGTMTFAMYGFLFILGLYLESVRRLSSFTAGLLIVPSSVFFVATSPLAGRLSARVGAGALMSAGLLFIAAGLLLLRGVVGEDGFVRMGVALALTGVGMGLNTGPAVNLAVGSVDGLRAGIAAGIVNLARMVGATMGVAVSGAVVAGRLRLRSVAFDAAFVAGMRHALLVSALVTIGGALVARIAVSRRQVAAVDRARGDDAACGHDAARGKSAGRAERGAGR